MRKAPTYTAQEIKIMCSKVNDVESFRILTKLIDEEIDLYNQEDMIILIEASMMLFTRSLLMGSIKNLR